MKDIIWPNHEAKDSYREGGFIHIYDSARADGSYKIAEDAFYSGEIQRLDDSERARLTTWLVNQRKLGASDPEITVEIIRQVKRISPLPAHERADRLLRYVAAEAPKISDYVPISDEAVGTFARSESTTWEEVRALANYIIDRGWVEAIGTAGSLLNVIVTVPGYSRIEELQTNVDSSQAFVAMWLDDSMNDVFDKGIDPAIRDAGYKPMLISQKEHINKIDDEIVAEIRRSRFMVADFSHGQDGARGSVYFEAGFAHGLGLNVIYTCHKKDMEKLHFDTRQYSHIVWETHVELRASLKTKSLAILGEGPEPARK